MKQLWYGGKIYTMEKENETVEAVLVEDGKIVAIGAATVLESQADEKYDLNGATMYPGFVDSHLHIISHGEKISRLDLSTAASLEENRLSAFAELCGSRIFLKPIYFIPPILGGIF